MRLRYCGSGSFCTVGVRVFDKALNGTRSAGNTQLTAASRVAAVAVGVADDRNYHYISVEL